MKTIRTILLIFAGISTADAQTLFPTNLTSSTLREGRWVWSSGHHISVRIEQRIVELKQTEGAWSITFYSVQDSARRPQPDGSPLFYKDGPYPVSQKDGVMTVERPEGRFQYSVGFLEDRVLFPVVVRFDARTFRFVKSERIRESGSWKARVSTRSVIWRCENDPSRVSKGKVVCSVNDSAPERVSYRVEHDGEPAIQFADREAVDVKN
ncbi:MAG: hypothetical protein AAF492_09385, partial [Verrucomicrobiota bacterium]